VDGRPSPTMTAKRAGLAGLNRTAVVVGHDVWGNA
jgi:hypothetical protein